MAKFHLVSMKRHAGKRWRSKPGYAFATSDALAPLVLQELPSAVTSLPIGFIKHKQQLALVAVLGLQPGRNLFIGPNGRWLGGYVPAALRAYPFSLAPTAAGQPPALCINEESGLLSETQGSVFFDPDGRPSQALSDVQNFLLQVAANQSHTQRVCTLLDAQGLIRPWPIKVQVAAGKTGTAPALKDIEGLYCIDEAALNRLPADAFLALRQAGALPLIYGQLFSMQHVQRLGQLADIHAGARLQANQGPQTLPTKANGDLDLDFMSRDGTINFSNF